MQRINDLSNKKTGNGFHRKSDDRKQEIGNFTQKLSQFYHWLFGISLKIKSPVQAPSHERNTNELMGKAFYFSIQASEKRLNSPVTGRVEKIFSPRSILIRTTCNLQVIVLLESIGQEESEEVESKNFSLVVRNGDKIIAGERIFTLVKAEKSEAVVYVPWQPFLIRKIDGANVYLRNPFNKLKTSLHGSYI